MNPKVIKSTSFVDQAATYILDAATASISNRGRFVLSLCGGSTPKPIYQKLATMGKELDWKSVIITFGDERCVPSDHADSNYRMAKESLFNQISIPPENILRMQGELPPEKAAETYEAQIRRLNSNKGDIFSHDLVLLGMGGDGHTASLFPETEALSEQKKWVRHNYVSKLNAHRLTLTFPLINAARKVCFLVNDQSKKSVIDNILSGGSTYPAAKAHGTEETVWILGC